MRLTLPRILAAVVVVLLLVGFVVLLTQPGRYKATSFLPAGNPNIIIGAPVLINGFRKGVVDDIVPSGPGAELTISMDSDVAPLHVGAITYVQWSAVVGERLINVDDGPKTNPEIPDGGRIEGNMPRPMEISDVLRSLDPATRTRLAPLATGLQAALKGNEENLNNTLRTAGPAVTALGNVTRGLATDGPALNSLVKDTNALVARIASRGQDLQGIIDDLSTSTRDTAAVRTQLRQVLQKLPPTLDQAQLTLAKVPGTVDATVPLLNDAKAATDRLPSVANNLEPLLRDLRPTIGELKPTLETLSELLDDTPGLLDSAKVTVPKLTEAFQKLTPTLRDIKPFSPCVVGLLSTFGSQSSLNGGNGGANGGNGQIVRVPLKVGAGALAELPVTLPPAVFAQFPRGPESCPSPFANEQEANARGVSNANLFPYRQNATIDPDGRMDLRADGRPLLPQAGGGTTTSNPVAALTGAGGLN